VPVLKLCVHMVDGRPCGRMFQPVPGARRNNRCELHQAQLTRREDERRNLRAKTSGRTTAAWKKLRAQVLERDDYACLRCGRRAFSVHIDPRLGGDHRLAMIDDCWSLCSSCHGTIDAPRAMRGRSQ
jgi:5-methylcytosine-specific restriction endonuclease McrA